jgi:glycosyltransferase involved in cell wall biosynthesis
MSKCIVSTSIGAEGIPITDGENILIADSSEAFAEKIKYALANPVINTSMGRNARSFAKKNYDNGKLMEDLLKFYIKTFA